MTSVLRRDWEAGAVALAIAAASAVWPPAALFAGVGVGVVAVWRRPALGLEVAAILVLVVRPSLDIFSERRFGLGPFAMNPSVAIGMVVLGLAVLALVKRGSEGLPIWPDREVRLVHILLLAAYLLEFASGFRFYGAQGFGEGVRELLRVLSIVAAFLVTWWWVTSGENYRRGWAYLGAGAIVPLGVSLWQLATGHGFSDIAGIYRIQGTFSHPNAYSQYLVPFIVVSVAGLGSRRGAPRLALIAVALGLSVLVALSYTRTAELALVLGLITVPFLQRGRIGLAGMLRGVAVITGFGLLGWLLVGKTVSERFSTLAIGREAIVAAETGESENSLEWRLVNWGVLVTLGMEHPLVGHGAGMTTVLNPIVNADNGVPFNAHDDFVRFFFEGGVVGLALYGLYALGLCRWAIRRARASPEGVSPTAFGVAAAVLALVVLTGGTTELSLQTADLYQLYGMLALVAGVPMLSAADRAAPAAGTVRAGGNG